MLSSSASLLLLLANTALGARPFLNEPDTGLEDVAGDVAVGTLPPLDDIKSMPDFDWAARHYMNTTAYTYYRAGAGGEWSYRDGLEDFQQYKFKPRVLRDTRNIENTLNTTILGYEFSAPFFISPAARGDYGNPEEKEKGLVHGANDGNVLWIPSLLASMSIEEIAAEKPDDGSQVLFQQMYLDSPRNDTSTKELIARIEAAGTKAIVLTVDSAADGDRQRAARYDVGSADAAYEYLTWDFVDEFRTWTKLPVILKGIMSVADAQMAVERGIDAIMLSNHGARQVDGAPSSLEVAIDIHNEAPEVFQQIEVLADGGVRYGTDILKLLALGVKAVGMARPFMYANCYGYDGVMKGINMLKHEVAIDAANIGLTALEEITPEYIKWEKHN